MINLFPSSQHDDQNVPTTSWEPNSRRQTSPYQAVELNLYIAHAEAYVSVSGHFYIISVIGGNISYQFSPLLCVSVRYLAKLSSVGSISDEETCERLRGLIQRQVHIYHDKLWSYFQICKVGRV